MGLKRPFVSDTGEDYAFIVWVSWDIELFKSIY